ncbi:MAG TPA: NUDIX domain-containing protein [Gemmatimonadales bacterium]|nr:NUDIX domain-containing protein [Gemmatimonadales bacterium]
MPGTRGAVSAGLLLFRRRDGRLELLLAHPGGPFWRHRDDGAWTIPKGVPESDEPLLEAARREFAEETGTRPEGAALPLGSIRQKAGKTVHAWAVEGDLDASRIVSNTMRVEWPPRSGRWKEIPEVDRCAWLDPDTARRKLNPAQAAFVDRLLESLAATAP